MKTFSNIVLNNQKVETFQMSHQLTWVNVHWNVICQNNRNKKLKDAEARMNFDNMLKK